MDEKEFNFKGKNSSFLWDSKNNILFIKLWGNIDAEAAEEFSVFDNKFFKEFFTGKSIKMLVDALDATSLNHEARRIFVGTIKGFNVKTKVAVCCKNAVFRVIGFFIAAVAKNLINILFFSDKEKALEWLNKE